MAVISMNELPQIGYEDLAAAIRFHRKKSGLSQIELARIAGVGKTVVFDLEKSKQSVQLDTLLKVLGALNIQIIFQSPIADAFLKGSTE
jgi:y4mF family transcriptional regulator